MAKSKTPGDKARKGAVKTISRIKNPMTGTWAKRDPGEGRGRLKTGKKKT